MKRVGFVLNAEELATNVKTQALYRLLHNYIDSTPEKEQPTFDALNNFLLQPACADNPRFILSDHLNSANNSHGTCLTQIFYFLASSHIRGDDPKFKIEKARKTFELLTKFIHGAMANGKISAEEYANLLKATNKPGFNVLHEVLLTGDFELIQRIFKEAADNTGSEYPKLLATKNRDNFTLLHEAVIANNSKLIQYIFNEVAQHADKEYPELLAAQSKGDFTLLHQAVLTRDLGIVQYVFNEIRAHASAAYPKLLETANKSNFTLLHEAIISENPEIVRYAFDEVRSNAPEIYSVLLTSKNDQGFTLLHEAVTSHNAKIIKYVFDEIKKHVAKDTLKKLLQEPTKGDWNLFHIATNPNKNHGGIDPIVVDILIDQFYDVFGKDDARNAIEALYAKQTQTGIPVFHETQPQWLRKILELSDDHPIQPTHWAR